ncbi:MAG: hypothetical protein BGN87_00140 [Rhizobiales bacterium 65-79]|nr:hypothetical protein [Hyphomicrobiales bacterium]OJU02595.1 MAG: hypothetical protein BGN87_00140 [Rhizobiales bacterium 65-79]
MTDVSITAANVKAGSNAIVDRSGNAGATVTAGEPVYKDATSGKYKLSDCNATGAKSCDGIALNGASDGQPLAILKGGDITIGGTLVAGTVYCVSATAGGIAPQADITTGDDVIILGVAKSASVLNVHIQTPGVTL